MAYYAENRLVLLQLVAGRVSMKQLSRVKEHTPTHHDFFVRHGDRGR